MKKFIIILAATTALAAPAFSQSLGETTGVNSTLGIAPKTQDFVTEAARSDMLEIAAAKIALQKGNADDKKFAEQMIADHTRTSAEMKQLIDSGAVMADLPTALDASSQTKIERLNNAGVDEFAAIYDPMQVAAHEQAVSLFERYAGGGDNARLKDFAGKTLPTLRHHLEMAQQIENKRRGATVGSAPSRETPSPYGAK
jgi:putative membrane protein